MRLATDAAVQSARLPVAAHLLQHALRLEPQNAELSDHLAQIQYVQAQASKPAETPREPPALRPSRAGRRTSFQDRLHAAAGQTAG